MADGNFQHDSFASGLGNFDTDDGHNPYYSEFSEFRIQESDSAEYVEFKMVNALNAQDNEDMVLILASVVDKLDG